MEIAEYCHFKLADKVSMLTFRHFIILYPDKSSRKANDLDFLLLQCWIRRMKIYFGKIKLRRG